MMPYMNQDDLPLSLLQGDRIINQHDDGFGMNKYNIDIYNSVYNEIQKIKKIQNSLDRRLILVLERLTLNPTIYDLSLMWFLGIVPFVYNNTLFFAYNYRRLNNVLQCSHVSLNNFFTFKKCKLLEKTDHLKKIMIDNCLFFNLIPHVLKYFVIRVCSIEYFTELSQSIRWIYILQNQDEYEPIELPPLSYESEVIWDND